MTTPSPMDGPAIALAPLAGHEPPFSTLHAIAEWVRQRRFRAISLPGFGTRLFDAVDAAGNEEYAARVRELLHDAELEVCSISVERESSLLAAHPAYEEALDRIVPPEHRGRVAREAWAAERVLAGIHAAAILGAQRIICRSGSLVWPYIPLAETAPPGIVATGFAELGRRWKPLLDACHAFGIDACFSIAAGQDICDGGSFERFLEAVDGHPRARVVYDPGRQFLLQIDYLEFVRRYRDRIGAFHLSDGEFIPNGRHALHGGFAAAHERPTRPRSLGEGMADLDAAFDAMLRIEFRGWATLDWACAVRGADDGVRISATYIQSALATRHIASLGPTEAVADETLNRRVLGLS